MARKKKPTGKELHRVWVPDDEYGGLRLTNGHGMMRIDRWENGVYEFRYVFCLHERLFGEGDEETWDEYAYFLHYNLKPYERLDGGDKQETFGQAKQDASMWYNPVEWVEVDSTHVWAVPTHIT